MYLRVLAVLWSMIGALSNVYFKDLDFCSVAINAVFVMNTFAVSLMICGRHAISTNEISACELGATC